MLQNTRSTWFHFTKDIFHNTVDKITQSQFQSKKRQFHSGLAHEDSLLRVIPSGDVYLSKHKYDATNEADLMQKVIHRKGQAVFRQTYPALPRSAVWCIQLKPFLLVRVTSAPASSKTCTRPSLRRVMASCKGVSPSASCAQQPQRNTAVVKKVRYHADSYS